MRWLGRLGLLTEWSDIVGSEMAEVDRVCFDMTDAEDLDMLEAGTSGPDMPNSGCKPGFRCSLWISHPQYLPPRCPAGHRIADLEYWTSLKTWVPIRRTIDLGH